MTPEEKQLLLKDLCARLPYGIKCKVRYWDRSGRLYVTGDMTLIGIIGNTCVFKTNFIHENTLSVDISEVKPYLRPMSSMTEEEEVILYGKVLLEPAYRDDDDACFNDDEIVSYVDYCYSRHLDIHGLIPKGLALEAPEGMYKTE